MGIYAEHITSGAVESSDVAANVLAAADIATGAVDSDEILDPLTGVMNIGAFASLLQGSGISLNDQTCVHRIYSDDEGQALTGNRRGTLSRTLLTVDQTGGLSIRGLMGQMKLASGVDHTNGTLCATQGYMEVVGASAYGSATFAAAVDASLECAGTQTINAGGFLSGLQVILNTSNTITEASTGVCQGVLITANGGSTVWPTGLRIVDSTCTTGMRIGTCTDGIILSGSNARHINITGAATQAQIYIGGTALLAAGEQAIYINCGAETVATNGVWITLKSNVTSGDCSGVRSKVTANSASSGLNARGIYAEAICGASLYAGVMQGVMGHASIAAGNCTVILANALFGQFSSGVVADVTDLYVGYLRCQTRGDETINNNDCLLGLENEAVLGNGRQMDSFIRCFGTNLGGGTKAAGYLIDGGTSTDLLATAFLRLPDDGTIAEDSGAGTGDADGADFTGFIKVIIGTNTRYIPLLSGTPAAIFQN